MELTESRLARRCTWVNVGASLLLSQTSPGIGAAGVGRSRLVHQTVAVQVPGAGRVARQAC